MKLTKLSLVATLAISSAIAGGDIVPVEPVVAPVENATTIAGKASLIYITNDSEAGSSMFDNTASAGAAAITLDVAHKFLTYFTANATAIGYTSLGGGIGEGSETWAGGYMDLTRTGAYFNVANITATYGDTTVVAGRQLLNTPMIQGYDWLIAPASFEAYTVVNNSIENLTLVGSYIDKYRANNSGEAFGKLNGDNWTVGASYSNGIEASIWYYDVAAANYSQVYADAGYTFSGVKLEGQYVSSTFDTGFGVDSDAFGAKVSTTLAGINLSAAYNRLNNGVTPYVSWNSLYVNSWNMSVADQYNTNDLDAYMFAADTKIAGIALSASYADFDEGYEIDVIAGYDITDAIDFSVVYSNNKVNVLNADDNNVLELYANYKF